MIENNKKHIKRWTGTRVVKGDRLKICCVKLRGFESRPVQDLYVV